MGRRIDVFISSTARDLPDHRKEAMDACLRQGMFPIMMEHLPASDSDAIRVSLEMVDAAEIYVGIFAFRYGYVPEGHDISITQMEYERAVEREIPRLIFLMDRAHPINIDQVEMGDSAIKLAALKKRLETENIVNYFKSPEELRAHLINSLSRHREPDLTALHYVSDIPEPPEAYIAHPYTLLHTRGLVGRQAELNLLTDWVAKPSSDVYRARILNVVALGGMGKSALTWKWFNDIAPLEMKPLAGRLWWSFYESDARFENFVIRALAYVSGRAREDVEKNTKPGEREDQLLHILDREPYLVVMDGLERILDAYARMDAAHMADDDYDRRTANRVAGAYGLPESAAQSFVGEHRLRKCADPRAGSFLRRLAGVRQSRVLVSTRLYPAELQMITGYPIPGSFASFLVGLSDGDALDLWREFGVSGARADLLSLFHRFENHPLLIKALAGEVAGFRRRPGDFDAWKKANPDFDPFRLQLVSVKSHVLSFALQGLDGEACRVLHTVAGFRMPAAYDTLADLLVEGLTSILPAEEEDDAPGEGEPPDAAPKPFPDEHALDSALTRLEDRGLLGWDRRANRYDLHPIVRGVVWGALSGDARRGVYEALNAHFQAVPTVDEDNVESLEDLTPAIELYNALVGLGRYDDAFIVFRDRLSDATLYRLSASRQRAEMLEMLFPDDVSQPPCLGEPSAQAYTLNSLALAYQFSGQPGRAAPLFRRMNIMLDETDDQNNLSIGLGNLAHALRLSGSLRESEAAARRALIIAREQKDSFREAISLQFIGLALAARGMALTPLPPLPDGEREEGLRALRRSLKMWQAQSNTQSEGLVNAYLAQAMLWRGNFSAARPLADRAWELARVQRVEGDFIRAARLQGEAALGLGGFETADERLHHALTRARAVNLAEDELPALVALAELRRRQGDPNAARGLLDDVWEAAERAPYPPFAADAFNVLAQLERGEGSSGAAVRAAEEAYRRAWCDGPPFAYHWGLEKAKKHLDDLGAPYPDLPPFDESQHEPMPEVEIDPDDEFHVGDEGETA